MATEITMFAEPMPDGHRGIAIEMMNVKGKAKRIAHTNLMLPGHPIPDITLSIPNRLSVAELKVMNEQLSGFIAKLEELQEE